MSPLFPLLLSLFLIPVRSLLVESTYRGPKTWVPLARFAIGVGAADKMRRIVQESKDKKFEDFLSGFTQPHADNEMVFEVDSEDGDGDGEDAVGFKDVFDKTLAMDVKWNTPRGAWGTREPVM